MKRIKNLTLFLAFLFIIPIAIAGPSGAFAQEGQQFVVSVDNVANYPYSSSGVFNTPTGASSPGPATPGSGYNFSFYAAPGEYVSFATMFVQSNDWFFAPDENGIPVYRTDGTPNTGDVTSYVALWDSGTEGDQPVGIGVDQAPRQTGPDTGPDDPDSQVRQVLSQDLPPTSQLIRATLSQIGPSHFNLSIDNISGNSSSPSPLAPGVFVVHSNSAPLFVSGQDDFGLGLEALAEDGNVAALGNALAAHSGINTPLAPVAWEVHQQPNALFATGRSASPGLEFLAEAGGPMMLVAEQGDANAGAAAVGRGASGPGPIAPPYGNYQFTINANPGDHLSLVTMFVDSNDWFYGLNSLPLFDENGSPRSGDVTHLVTLYDAGTEVDEAPGYGPNQAPRQAGPDSGQVQNGVVMPINHMNGGNIHITITPLP